MYIDTHAHLFVEDYANDMDMIVERTKKAKVEKVLLPNIDVDTIDLLKSTYQKYPDLFIPMMGLHPTSVKSDYQSQLNKIYRELTSQTKYVAIGEIGIDLYWDKTYIKEQIDSFEQQLKWSIEMDLPVAIHSRNSYQEIIASLKKIGGSKLRGVFHSFSGDENDLDQLLKFDNFYIGINGIVTFKNSKLSEVLKKCPIKKIVLETDSPYLSPVPFRGKRNEPQNLEYINNAISDIYRISPVAMAQITKSNALSLFDLNG